VQNKIFRGDRGCRNALPGLELLAIAVDQGDASHRHLKDGLGKPRDAVKGVLGLGVQHLITVKRGKPGTETGRYFFITRSTTSKPSLTPGSVS